MIKKFYFLTLSLFAAMNLFAGPQGEDNGLDLKFDLGFHNQKYAFADVDLADYGILNNNYPFARATPTIGFTLDSRWYLANPGSVGIALNARWVDFAFASCRSKIDLEYQRTLSGVKLSLPYTVRTKTQFYDLSLCGLGPMGTFYFNSKMAVDLYYVAMPNFFLVSMGKREISSDNDMFQDVYQDIMEKSGKDRTNTFAFGCSHRIGAAFRYKVLEIGAEVKFGRLNYMDWGEDEEEDVINQGFAMYRELSGNKIRTGAFRIFLGFKFR